jgi:hypothetical protein
MHISVQDWCEHELEQHNVYVGYHKVDIVHVVQKYSKSIHPFNISYNALFSAFDVKCFF